MRLRMALVAMAAILLSSCWWGGPAFFKGDPADAAPIKPGLYQIWVLDTSSDKPVEKPGRLHIVWLPDGTTRWTKLAPGKVEDNDGIVMARLGKPGRDLWIIQTPLEKDKSMFLYSLAEMRAGLMWVQPVIDCAATADLVRAAGGTVTEITPEPTNEIDTGMADDKGSNMMDDAPPSPRDCTFPTRASLDAAITAYLATNPKFTQRLRFRRIGN